MGIKTSRMERQYQMSDELYKQIIEYIKYNNLTFSQFCNNLGIPKYFLGKIMNRKIKMYSFIDLLKKVANYIEVNGINLYIPQPYKY